jgi:hypothetical protein
MASNVYRWGCDGGDRGRVGREGTGPGEARGPWVVAEIGPDTVALWDANLLRLTWFTSRGDFLGSRRLQVGTNLHGRLDGFGVAGGRTYVWTNNFPPGGPRPNEQRSFVWRVDSLGILRDSIVSMKGPESIIDRDETSQSRIDAPFQRRPVVIFLRDGGFLVGNTGDSLLRRFDSGGALTQEVVLKLPVVKVTTRDRRLFTDSARAGLMAELSGRRFPSDLRAYFVTKFDRMLRNLEFPETRQRYVIAALDPTEARFWVQLPTTGPSPERIWQVFRVRDGILDGVVKVPHVGSVADAAVGLDGLYTIEAVGDGIRRVYHYVRAGERP